MDREQVESRFGGGEEPAAEPLADAGALVAMLHQLGRRFSDLFAAELRQAGLSMAIMLALAVVVAVLVTGAWALACAAVAVAAWNAGFSLAATLALMALLNAAAAAAAVLTIRACSSGLTFAATRRSLGPDRERHGDASPGERNGEQDHVRPLASA